MSADFPNDPDPTNPYAERTVHVPEPRPRRRFPLLNFLAVIGCIVVLIALLMPAPRASREAARRFQCVHNLKQIALAIHNYESLYKSMPPAYTVGVDGRPLHSWRTLILPYLGEEALYKTIDLTKPWNAPANATALHTVLPVYLCPSAAHVSRNETTYLAVVGPGACFLPRTPRPMKDITDGASNTLMVVEAGEADGSHAVPWMAPSDADESLVVTLGPGTTFHHPGGMNTAFVDGSVKFLKATVAAPVRRALVSVAGGEEISADQY
jgi:prepilin-type processing-associated H-X9-DG protein